MKLKAVITFVFCGMFVILLFSSFDAEDKFDYATDLNLSNQMMLYAFTSDYTALSSDSESDDTADEDRAESYQVNDADDYILHYKMILYYLGDADYPEDNVFDVTLQSNVLTYQQNKGLEVTGVLTTATMNALDAEEIEYTQGQHGDAIATYQTTLQELGYISTTYDLQGVFDDETRVAVKAYQLNNSLDVTGTINAATQKSLGQDLTDQVQAAPDSEQDAE